MQFLILLVILLRIFVPEKEPSEKKRIAILMRSEWTGELSFAYRMKAACQNINWRADVFDIEEFKRKKKVSFDFVVNLVPGSFKLPKSKYYLAIFHPQHHYFDSKGKLLKPYDRYNGYLLSYLPKSSDPNFGINKKPFLLWYPTAPIREYKEVEPTHLFHICSLWGNRYFDAKMQQFIKLLDQEDFMRFYGHAFAKTLCPQRYCSPIPFDNDRIYEIQNNAGITLILHSDDHNAAGLPSGRIFESAAASAIIISDENAFVKEHFKDSVLYIDTKQSPESIYRQVKGHMDWIQSHKEAAKEKAKTAHAIYKNHFSLEDQLRHLGKFHDELTKSPLLKCKEKIRSFFKKKNLHFMPIATLPNIDCSYSLINSVDFHTQKNSFCVTFTHNNKISLFEIDKNHAIHAVQTLSNPKAKLSDPQHAVFSPDGKKLVVANWTNQTMNIYLQKENGLFNDSPSAIIETPSPLQNCKPHGIAFSPCGNYLAVAYGASVNYDPAIALFQFKDDQLECISYLKNPDLQGTPKGITFTPDGSHLLVTFCDTNCIGIFPIQDHILQPTFQRFIGEDTGLFRPEDIKLTPDGRYCAVTNSEKNTVTFYPFDPKSNAFLKTTPCLALQNPESNLSFPHGIAFSPDGAYIAITQFGPIHISEEGDIFWDPTMKSSLARINLYLYKELLAK